MKVKVLCFTLLFWSFCVISVKTDLRKLSSQEEDSFGDWDEYNEDEPGELSYDYETPSTQQHFSHVNFTHEGCQHVLVGGYSLKNTYYSFNYGSSKGKIRLLVRFRGKSDGHVILSQYKDIMNGSFYTIVIGGGSNQRIAFLRNASLQHTEIGSINTPNILSEHHYRGFIIEYDTVIGHLSLLPEGSGVAILYWTDPNPLDIKFFSFSSSTGVVVHVAFNCVGEDALSLVPSETFIVNGTREF